MARNSNKRRAVLLALAAGAIVAAGVAGCAPASSSGESQPPTATLQTTPGSSVPSVVLTQLGKQRIGLQTAPVGTGPGGRATFPYSALLYEPNGTPAVYVPTGQFTFLRHYVKVAAINGNTVVVASGLTPGQSVVTAGAEELLGVQNGVGEET
jgi:multidrug efflux pump subunit AcrA (membrane-fusion protein)